MNDSPVPPDLLADLADARFNCRPLDWSPALPASLSQAYALALAVRQTRTAQGDVPVGYKVGFTNRSLWPRYEVYAPIWGTVWQSTMTQVVPGAPNAAVLSLDGLCEPRIEPEIVFCLRAAPPPDCTAEQLVASLDWVAHGFEIVHTHFAHWKFTAAQAVADAGLHGFLLVGHRIQLPAQTPSLEAIEPLARLKLRLYGDGVLKDEGSGANVLDGPVQALLHFVRELRATPGAPALKAGDVVTTGTLTDAHPVQAGQTWHTEIDASGDIAGAIEGLTVRFK